MGLPPPATSPSSSPATTADAISSQVSFRRYGDQWDVERVGQGKSKMVQPRHESETEEDAAQEEIDGTAKRVKGVECE
ncbi:hypothetical protein IAR50_001631 [Cryptococcus sp. DSM 104548]